MGIAPAAHGNGLTESPDTISRVPADPRDTGHRPAILCLSPSFTPDTTPTAIRAGKLLGELSRDWDVTVLSESAGPHPSPNVEVRTVRSRRPRRLLSTLRRLRMDKLLELAVWPDESIFWVLPAVRAARRLTRERRPEAIVVFMMPYAGGLAGVLLRRLTGLPLILNLDDSPTCTDMHPHFPSRLHYRLARWLEDLYMRRADAVVYVSARNLEQVRERQPEPVRGKLRLVRYGANHSDFTSRPQQPGRFEIAYAGAMSGWWSLLDDESSSSSFAARVFERWARLGRYERTKLDQRTSSPAAIGHAITKAIASHSDWEGKVGLTIYGNPYPEALVARALSATGVEDVVTVHGPVPHGEVASVLAEADLLFLTLPRRVDGSAGGRISAKTYEYLATDRPILAAAPRGENWDYLSGKPGVWLVEPDDEDGMEQAIVELAEAKLNGAPRTFDRTQLHEELSYATRAREFDEVLREGIARR
jgi:glycosyltransferase involved in cell wall biosynthesis